MKMIWKIHQCVALAHAAPAKESPSTAGATHSSAKVRDQGLQTQDLLLR